VESGADDGAVLCEAAEGARSTRPGVDIPETSEPREISGSVVAEWLDESGLILSAADIVLAIRRHRYATRGRAVEYLHVDIEVDLGLITDGQGQVNGVDHV